MSKAICALARAVCPETADPAKGRYCPCWNDAIPEHERDGSGRVTAEHIYRGCMLPKLIPYLQGMTAEADHSHAAANETRDAVSAAVERLDLRMQELEVRLQAFPAFALLASGGPVRMISSPSVPALVAPSGGDGTGEEG